MGFTAFGVWNGCDGDFLVSSDSLGIAFLVFEAFVAGMGIGMETMAVFHK